MQKGRFKMQEKDQNLFKEVSQERRREIIMDLLNREGKVKVSELSKLFGISEVSIRSDLAFLEKQNMLQRVHGGAVSTLLGYYHLSFNERMKECEDEKRRIGKALAKRIEDGDSIMVNSGTTTFYAAQEMRNMRDLIIITNAISIATEIAYSDTTQIILLGGNYDHQYRYSYGSDTLSQLEKYRTRKMIMSVDGVDANVGVTTHYYLESEVTRQMMEKSNEVIVLADHTKIGLTGLITIEDISKIDVLITDDKAPKRELDKIKGYGVEVVIV